MLHPGHTAGGWCLLSPLTVLLIDLLVVPWVVCCSTGASAAVGGPHQAGAGAFCGQASRQVWRTVWHTFTCLGLLSAWLVSHQQLQG